MFLKFVFRRFEERPERIKVVAKCKQILTKFIEILKRYEGR